ncbi:hypothetical protein NKJ87_27440 [Mesorhizobium sp. M0027]|uniref:hypothetical protein n=1 Tax=Mesorhizobium sp. M0027 TaxID=2956848 RepID=UPI003335EEB9
MIATYLAIFMFTLCNAVPFVVERSKQIFQPIKLYACVQVLIMVPAMIIVSNYPEYIQPSVFSVVASDFQASLTWTIFCYALMNLTIYTAYYSSVGGFNSLESLRRSRVHLTEFESIGSVIFLLAVGTLAFYAKIKASGGLEFLMSNVSRRVELQSGLGPLNFIISSSYLLANVAATRRVATKGDVISGLLLFSAFITGAATSSLFGGRKDTLQLLLTIIMVASLSNPKFMRFNIKNILVLSVLYASVILYYFAVLIYRNANSLDGLTENFQNLVSMTLDSYSSLIISLSYIDTYLFATNFFKWDNFYLGRTFIDLTTAFLPSSLYEFKPPVDDGLYIRAATLGYLLEPGTPAADIVHNSWPGETLGTGYMNAGLAGVLISGWFVGYLLAKGYAYSMKNPDSIVGIVIVCNLFLNFEMSNLRIVNLISSVIGAILVLLLYKAARRVLPFI